MNEDPCDPFIAMYLTDIAYISDEFNDQKVNISFLKRHRWYAMLRSQMQPYDRIVEDPLILTYISDCLTKGETTEDRQIWEWYNAVLQSELQYSENIAILGGDPPLSESDVVWMEFLGAGNKS
ncbi:hypothetical protein B0H13DRAFT_2319767 [Mycena leptocephala]|nr:hypothetical protein B0H13DRAFT_2319767 [Mycena leptocephala]